MNSQQVHNMKRAILISMLAAVASVFTGCISSQKKALYYSMDNWVIRQNAVPRYFAVYDVFYVYPTMLDNSRVTYLNWSKPPLYDDIYNYTSTQTTEIFDTAANMKHKGERAASFEVGSKVRVFAPFVHQVEYTKYMDLIKDDNYAGRKSPLRPGIKDTLRALNHYLKYYHKKGRPFILYGQGQGAIDLYEAMRRCPKVKPSNGFVAAYFTGIPRLTMEKINKDFNRRGIYAGVDEYSTGVVLSWNIQTKYNPESPFIMPYGYVINPINWRIDSMEATIEEDKGSSFYDFNAEHISEKKLIGEHLSSAEIEIDRGVLMVDEQQLVDFFPNIKLGEGEFRGNIYSLFGRNVVENAEKRVLQYLYKSLWHKEKVSRDE